jgi:uncharacterized transporter YbjL
VRDLLAGNPLLWLFTAIGLGRLIGNINVFGFKLGVDAVLLVGLALGTLGSSPEFAGEIPIRFCFFIIICTKCNPAVKLRITDTILS